MTLAEAIQEAEQKLGYQDVKTLRDYRKAHHDPDAPSDPEQLAKVGEIVSREPDAAQIILEGPM